MEWFEVAVELPERTATPSYVRRKPRGTYILAPESDEEERLFVPLAVARKLKRRIETGEMYPGSRAEALYMLGEASRSCAVRRVEDLLNRRDYAEGELRCKLEEDGYTSKVIDEVMERAREGRAVDDARFAEAFIRSKVNAGWGRQRIERELAQRGIEASDVEGWPEEFVSIADEPERAYELASKRRLTGKNDYVKLMRFLISRGFTSSEAKSAVKRILAEAEEDERLR